MWICQSCKRNHNLISPVFVESTHRQYSKRVQIMLLFFHSFDQISLFLIFVTLLFNTSLNFPPFFGIKSGHTWFCAVDMSQPIPLNSNIFPSNHIKIRKATSAYYPGHQEYSRKRKHPNATEVQNSRDNKNLTICMRYVGMLFMDFLDSNELVIVEQPWVDIAKSLPRSLQRKLYGT